MDEPTEGFSFLEHTADVGIRAWGASLAAAFEQAGRGVASLMGAVAAPPGRLAGIHVEGVDAGGLLVAFLDDLVFRCETGDGEGLASLRVTFLGPTSLDAVAEFAPIARRDEGAVVKAATYHGLEVAARPDGSAEVRVYLDV